MAKNEIEALTCHSGVLVKAETYRLRCASKNCSNPFSAGFVEYWIRGRACSERGLNLSKSMSSTFVSDGLQDSLDS